MNRFETPILLLIFNRPDTTKVVFNAIRKLKPTQLFIAADGPRPDHAFDNENCLKAQRVAMNIDWPCEVHRLVNTKNIGCGKGPASGISWFFEHVEEGIILEDDIHPSPDFFSFCQTLLEFYRTDNRVMEIGGVNLIEKQCATDEADYFFSNHNHTWGWATWRRAWKYFDYSIRDYRTEMVQTFLRSSFNSDFEYHYFKNLFDVTFENTNEISWWDYQWEFARRINAGLSIVPNKNLITNIGLGAHATHTVNAHGIGANLSWSRLNFPLRHPHFVLADWAKDYFYFRDNFSTSTSRLRFQLEKLIPEFFRHKRSSYQLTESQLTLNKN